MSDPDIKEEEALTALLESDGWALLMAHLDTEWGATAYAARIDQAIATAKANRDSAETDIGELGAACRAVRVFAQWPEKRRATLKATREKKPRGFALQRRA